MDKEEASRLTRDVVLDNPDGIVLNFNEISSLSTKSQEIRRSLLTGKHTKGHKLHPANIVLSAIREFFSEGGDFGYVDFKDSSIEQAEFDGCSFDYAAIINCQFEDTQFSSCHFYNVSITGSLFQNVTFRDCALDHMVIESCKFLGCRFINCTTSNKLFEYCLIDECTFTKTNVQVQTITSNFGITAKDLTESEIRDRSIDESFSVLEGESLETYPVSTPIEAFKIAYFLDPGIVVGGAEAFDTTFELESWVGTAKIPLTFANLLSIYSDFLLRLYDDSRIFIFPILRLHSLSGSIVERASVPPSVMTSVYGVHMILSRVVEEYLTVVTSYVRTLGSSASVVANGPLDRDYYVRNYAFLFDRPHLTIEKIQKHNSPNEIFLSWDSAAAAAPLVAAFMASRFKFEIAPYRGSAVRDDNAIEAGAGTGATEGKELVPTQTLFELRMGFDGDNKYLYGIKLKSIFPGNLLVELGIHLSVSKIAAVRDLIVGILKSDERKL